MGPKTGLVCAGFQTFHDALESEMGPMAMLSLTSAVALLHGVQPSRLIRQPRLDSVMEAQRTAVVRVPGFLDEEAIHRVDAVAALVAASAGEQDIHRRQGAPAGSWSTVFINAQLSTLLPTLHDALFAAARQADTQTWKLLDEERSDLAFRCVEYHAVTPGGGIPMAKHHDWGSLLTLDVMLSDPGTDFEGGAFQTLEDGAQQTHRFERGDLLIFHSHKYHSVQPVTAGRRRVLVSEIWEGLPRRCARRCDTPWGPCVCNFAPPPAIYALPAKTTKIKPCLRLMAQSDAELQEMCVKLEQEGSEEQRCTVGSHCMWKRSQALIRKEEY